MRNSRRDRRRRLAERRQHLELRLVDLLDTFIFLVLCNLLEILHRAVEQWDADMGLLERTDIVCAVPAISGMKPRVFKVVRINSF